MTWRQNVRSAERKGVIIREATNETDFETDYELLKITSERDAFFIHQKEYHQEILRHFASKGYAVLYLAEHEGEAIAAKMLIRFGYWGWNMFGASSNNKRNLSQTISCSIAVFSGLNHAAVATSIFALFPKSWSLEKRCGVSMNRKRAFAGSPVSTFPHRIMCIARWFTTRGGILLKCAAPAATPNAKKSN